MRDSAASLRRRTLSPKLQHPLLSAVACLLLFLYLSPVACIVLAPARRLPHETQSQSAIEVEELSAAQSGVLLRASGFTASQLSNEPFPAMISGIAPGQSPPLPPPRIRTARSDYRDWYANVVTVVFFPIVVLAGGGPILFAILAIGALSAAFKQLAAWHKVIGILVWAVLFVLLAAITYSLAIWPRVLRTCYSRHSPLIWEDSALTHYLEGGFSVDPQSPDKPTLTRLVVVNGIASPIDLYADGFHVDLVPAYDIRGYRQLTGFSRLTSVDSASSTTVDDFHVRDTGDREGLLIYNVHGADSLHVEKPPRYE